MYRAHLVECGYLDGDTRMQYFQNQLNLFPNENARVFLKDAAGTPLVIPGGSVVSAIAATVLGIPVADLGAVISDANKGIIGIRLPDNTQVRDQAGKALVYDVRLTLPGGISKTISPGYLRVTYSASVWAGTPLTTPNPTVAPTIPNTLPPNPTPIKEVTLSVQDMVWINDQGQKVMMRIKQDGNSQAIELVPVT